MVVDAPDGVNEGDAPMTMRWEEQGGGSRYAVIPRTLTFLFRGDKVLLLRGTASKARWGGRLNGLGGHVEPGEDVRASALRDVREEAGLAPADLALAGILHITGPSAGEPGIMLFVYAGEAPPGAETVASGEGALEWHPIGALPRPDVLDDLPLLIPRVHVAWRRRTVLYGRYRTDADGTVHPTFS